MSDNDKPRPNARLAGLTPDQREVAWLNCEQMSLKEGVLWLKAQYGIETNTKGLSAWLRKLRAQKSLDEYLDRLRFTKEQALIIGNACQSAAAFDRANTVVISQLVFEELQKKPADRNEPRLIEMIRLSLQAGEQDIKKKSVNLQQHKFQFDSAGAVRRHFNQLKEIEDGPGDETEKINQVRLLLFGERPDITDFSDARPVSPEKEDPA